MKKDNLLDFLEHFTNSEVFYWPEKIIVPSQHHEEFRAFWGRARGGLESQSGWYNAVLIELSDQAEDIEVVFSALLKRGGSPPSENYKRQ